MVVSLWGNWADKWRNQLGSGGGRQIWTLKGSRLRQTGWVLLLGLLGLMLIFAGKLIPGLPAAQEASPEAVETLGGRKTAPEPTLENDFAAAEKTIAGELERVLAQIKGAGKVTVSVTLQSGGEKVYAANKVVSNRKIEEKDTGGGSRVTTEVEENNQMVIVRDSQSTNERLVVVKEMKPEVSGVIVVAEGAGSSQVRADLTRAVQTVLAIPANRVQVFAK